jgi:hypothetical protein
MMGDRLFLALLLSVGLLGLSSEELPAASNEPALPNAGFEFAIIGDLPYTAQDEAKFPDLVGRINRTNVVFVVHNGDFKSGSSPCTDALFYQRHGLFQTFKHPLIYIFGDNEWTDCHRSKSDPLERLAKLREIFSQGNSSFGQSPLPLIRQSDTPPFSKFRENVRWHIGRVVFIGLNIPGSNNNFPTTLSNGVSVGNIEEYSERNTANLVWMREAFALATQAGSPGLMLFIQGNPFPFAPSDGNLKGFEEFLAALEEETLKFGKPVVLAHGDSHYFRVDHPLPRPDPDGYRRPRIVNFTRVENFGSPDVSWVRGSVDPHDPKLFSFKPELLP